MKYNGGRMGNVLKMEKQILIEPLLALGWSYRKIQSETGIRRETVAKYDPRQDLQPQPVLLLDQHYL